MNQYCPLCDCSKISVKYTGKIRYGKFGNYLDNQTIFQCEACEIKYYNNSDVNYAKSEYRDLVQDDSSELSYYKAHDKEQLHNIEVLGLETLRNKTVADVGCGAGSFLDCIKGVTKDQIAIEPFEYYQKILASKGYKVFDYVHNADDKYERQIDVITSFAVIEHVDNPIRFLEEIKKLVKKHGYILLSTPNADDWLLKLLPNDYASFYYRYVHKWYFNEKSLEKLARKIGFKNIEFKYKQRYDISNLLMWLRDKRPTGLGKVDNLKDIDSTYQTILEKQGISDFLYVKLYV